MLSGLRAMSGRTGMRLGATWTALVVIQIALSLAALPEEGVFESNNLIRFNHVDELFFDVFNVQAGRDFGAGDFEPAGTAVIVNRGAAVLGQVRPGGR
jgi:hypothetical protein